MKLKKLLLVLIIMDVILITIGIKYNYDYQNLDDLYAYRFVTLDDDAFYKFIKDNNAIISFYANTFQIEENTLISLLKDNNIPLDNEKLENNLLDFLINLEKKDKELFDNTIQPCEQNKDYILALIKYWTNFYPNVDFTTAASIGYIESGYRAKHLLKKNNIFGGKGKNGILSYKNIEYGTLKFVRLLSTGYYGKGLDTIEKIGVKYNPIYDENGKKIANPNWVHDVNITLKKYRNYKEVDIFTLLNLRNNNDNIDNNYLF